MPSIPLPIPLPGFSGPQPVPRSLQDPFQVILLHWYLRNFWIPAFQQFTRQMTTTMMNQALIVGTFWDAKNQLETQQLMEKLRAEAYKDYRPDLTICYLGTNVRSLAATEQEYKTNARILSIGLQQRDLLPDNMESAEGFAYDIRYRLDKYKSTYCDFRDANGEVAQMCNNATGPQWRVNRDINYTRTVEARYTMDVDFTDAVTTEDEEDVIALGHNLFNFTVSSKIPKPHLEQEHAKDDFQDMRSVNAIRSVAQNSYGHLVGMRARGMPTVPQSQPFMVNFMVQMGMPLGDAIQLMGDNPSYFAQMEFLTSKIYENGSFYANLYTSPANVMRISVALEAIKLMQDRDRFEASLRREVLISLILELKIRELEEGVYGKIPRNLSTVFGEPE